MDKNRLSVRIDGASQVVVEIPQENAAFINLRIGDSLVAVPLDRALFATFRTKFMRKQPTDNQREVHGMVMAMMAAAYLQGMEDGARVALDQTTSNEAES